MKETELMTGDWMTSIYDKMALQITVIDSFKECVCLDHRDWVSVDNLQPIPLTQEIIDKLSDVKELIVFWDDRKTEETGENWYEVCINCDNGNTAIITIRFVHELQNALRLYGVEKEITI